MKYIISKKTLFELKRSNNVNIIIMIIIIIININIKDAKNSYN